MTFSNRFIDVAFGKHPLEELLSSLRKDANTLSAVRLLTAMEGESESILDELFDHLSCMGTKVDISDLPAYTADSQIGQRLCTEQQLVKNGNLLKGLELTDPLRVYLQEISQIPALGNVNDLAEELKAANRNEDTDAPVLTDVLNQCLHRVVDIAYTYVGNGVLLMDLIQEGSMGLWESLPNYDDGDVKQFCDYWIRWHMDKAVVKQAYASGVGHKLGQGIKDYRDADQRLLGELGRNPTLEEIAEAIHVTADEAAVYAEMLQQARAKERRQQTTQPKEKTPEDDQAVENTAYFQTRQRIVELLSTLSEQEAKLLTLRFGLEGGLPKSPQQTGEVMGLTADEVVQIEAAALAKLRQQGE